MRAAIPKKLTNNDGVTADFFWIVEHAIVFSGDIVGSLCAHSGKSNSHSQTSQCNDTFHTLSLRCINLG